MKSVCRHSALFLILLLAGVAVAGEHGEGAASPDITLSVSQSPALLEGQVLDDETGLPLVGAHIRLTELGLLVVADKNGRFSFVSLAAGDWTLTVTHVGYHQQLVPVRIREGMSSWKTLRLLPETIEMTPIQVRGQRTTPSLEPNMIDRTRIEQANWEDVGEAVSTLPGVNLLGSGGLGSAKRITYRGCRPEQVLVEVDGVFLNDGSGNAVDLATIPLANVHKIEIEPRSDHGNAQGGVLHILTQQGSPFANNGRGYLELEQYGGIRGGWSIERNGATSRWYTAGQLSNADGKFEYEDNSASFKRNNNEMKRVNLSFGNEYTFVNNWKSRLDVSAGGYQAGSPAPLYQPPTPDAEHSQLHTRSSLKISRPVSNSELVFIGYVTSNAREFENPARQVNPYTQETMFYTPVHLEELSIVYGGSVSLDAASPGVRGQSAGFSIGGSYESFDSQDRAQSGGVEQRLLGTVYRSNGHATAQFRGALPLFGYPLETRVNAGVAGYRDLVTNSVEKETQLFIGNCTFTWKQAVQDGWSWGLHIGGSNSFTPPPFSASFLSESIFALGNPELEPEKAQEVSGGVSLGRSDMFSTLDISLTGFYRSTRDLITWRQNYRGQYYPANVGKALTQGLETAFGLSLFQDRVTWRNAFTWQHVRNNNPNSPYYENHIPFQPDWYGSSQLSLAWRQWFARTEWRFSARRYSTESNLDYLSLAGGGLEPYGVIDIAVGGDVSREQARVTLELGVDNVTNTQYELLDRMPMPGRIWRISLDTSWRSRN